MRKLRKTIALYVILALTFCALTALPTYADAGGPQGEVGAKEKAAQSDDWLWEYLCQLLGLD